MLKYLGNSNSLQLLLEAQLQIGDFAPSNS